MKGIKFTFEQVKSFIESINDYVLLSTEYKGNFEKLQIKCNFNHVFEMTRADIQQGHRCPICANNIKYNIQYIQDYLNNENYTLISTEYKNSLSKIKIECPEGHIYDVSFNSFQQGCRCPVCAGNKKLDYYWVKAYIEDYKYKLISENYINSNIKLQIQCPKGHIYYAKFNNFQQGQRCPVCFGKVKHTFEYVKNFIEKDGYKLLSDKYINNRTPLEIVCKNNHVFYKTFHDINTGEGCPICVRQSVISKPEKEITEYVKTIYNNEIIENDRTQIINPKTRKMLELDIYLPEINKAIEFNGNHWHSSDYAKYKDEQKVLQCKEKGIDLLIITDDKYKGDKDNVLNLIYSFIFT
jgi:hypothetical protein